MKPKNVWIPIFIVLAASLILLLFNIWGEMIDFEVNYKAAQRLRVGETLYRTADEHYQFKYMPVSSFLYLPLTLVPLDVAKTLWYFVVLSASIGLVFLSNKIIEPKAALSWTTLIFPPLVLLKFLFREIQLGQINSIVTLILLALTWMISEDKTENQTRKELLAGLIWGLATALKPYALIFLPYFVVKKKWKSLLAGIGLLATAFIAPSLYYGFKGNVIVHKEWISTFSQSTPALLTTQDNVSIIAFFSKWIGDQTLSFIFTGVTIAFLTVLVLFLIIKGRGFLRASVLECAVLLASILLVSPLGWDYTFLMSILGLTIIIRHFHIFTLFWKSFLILNLCVISLSLYDLLGREAYAAFMSWSVLTINSLILIGYLSYLRLKKIA